MQIKFESNLLTHKQVLLRSISRSTINPMIVVNENGLEKKYAVPASVGRTMIKDLHNTTRLDIDYPIGIIMYDGEVVACDVPQYKEVQMWTEDPTTLKLCCEDRINFLIDETSDSDWFIDGTHVYQDTDVVVQHDEMFYVTGAIGFNLNHMGYAQKTFDVNNYSCYAAMIEGELHRTPPILVGFPTDTVNWFQLIDNTVVEMKYTLSERFDNYGFPNLSWVNYSAKLVNEVFGPQAVEALALPLHVIEQRTFNLSALPREIQLETPSVMKSCEAFAWILGLFDRSTTLHEVSTVAKILRMLRNKGYTLRVSDTTTDVGMDNLDMRINQLEMIRTKCRDYEIEGVFGLTA